MARPPLFRGPIRDPSHRGGIASAMRCRPLLACALFATFALSPTPTLAQHSVARQWNEALLETIGHDYADPTIQSRNLFHTSIALYDAWAAYGDGPEQTYLLGQTVGGFTVPFAGMPRPGDVEGARCQAHELCGLPPRQAPLCQCRRVRNRLTRIHVSTGNLGCGISHRK